MNREQRRHPRMVMFGDELAPVPIVGKKVPPRLTLSSYPMSEVSPPHWRLTVGGNFVGSGPRASQAVIERLLFLSEMALNEVTDAQERTEAHIAELYANLPKTGDNGGHDGGSAASAE